MAATKCRARSLQRPPADGRCPGRCAVVPGQEEQRRLSAQGSNAAIGYLRSGGEQQAENRREGKAIAQLVPKIGLIC